MEVNDLRSRSNIMAVAFKFQGSPSANDHGMTEKRLKRDDGLLTVKSIGVVESILTRIMIGRLEVLSSN